MSCSVPEHVLLWVLELGSLSSLHSLATGLALLALLGRARASGAALGLLQSASWLANL